MVGNPSSVSSPKLLDQVRGKIRLKHYSIRTEQTYTDWIKRYLIPRQATRHVTQTMTAAAYSGKTSNCLIKNLSETHSLPHVRNLSEMTRSECLNGGQSEVNDERQESCNQGVVKPVSEDPQEGEGADS